MVEPGIVVTDASVERGGHLALTGITFEVGPGTLMGILGPNGAGKSTCSMLLWACCPLRTAL